MKHFSPLLIPVLGFMTWVVFIMVLSQHTILFYTASAFVIAFGTAYLFFKYGAGST